MADADGATKFADVEKVEVGLRDLSPKPVKVLVRIIIHAEGMLGRKKGEEGRTIQGNMGWRKDVLKVKRKIGIMDGWKVRRRKEGRKPEIMKGRSERRKAGGGQI